MRKVQPFSFSFFGTLRAASKTEDKPRGESAEPRTVPHLAVTQRVNVAEPGQKKSQADGRRLRLGRRGRNARQNGIELFSEGSDLLVHLVEVEAVDMAVRPADALCTRHSPPQPFSDCPSSIYLGLD